MRIVIYQLNISETYKNNFPRTRTRYFINEIETKIKIIIVKIEIETKIVIWGGYRIEFSGA